MAQFFPKEMHMLRAKSWLLALAGMGIVASFARAEIKEIKPVQAWKGSVKNRELLGQPPTVIGSAAVWKAQWKAWYLEGDVPEVDFGKKFVVIKTTVGSVLNLILRLDNKGDLKVLGMATRDLRPGFRYAMAAVAREGVKTVNGAALPTETKEGEKPAAKTKEGEKPAAKTEVTGNVTGPAGDLEAGLVVKIQLLDVSLMDVPAKVLGEQVLRDPKAFPIPFAVPYDAKQVSKQSPTYFYTIGVRIEKDGQLRYISDTHIPVIAGKSPTTDVKAPVIKVK